MLISMSTDLERIVKWPQCVCLMASMLKLYGTIARNLTRCFFGPITPNILKRLSNTLFHSNSNVF